MAAAVQPGARVRRDAQVRYLVRQPQAALQKVAYPLELRPRVEPLRLRAVRRELQDELVSARRARWALRLEHPQALQVSVQFSEPPAQLAEASACESQELQV